MVVEYSDYSKRRYLSASEAARYLNISVRDVHRLVRAGKICPNRATSGQMRFDIKDLMQYEDAADRGAPDHRVVNKTRLRRNKTRTKGFSDAYCGSDAGCTYPKFLHKKIKKRVYSINVNGTFQNVFIGNSMRMAEIPDNGVHLMITSPPYFDTKMYSRDLIKNDLGNVHNEDDWFRKIKCVWKEVYRVLQPGRKAFINIMNLPVRDGEGSFRTLNLVGRTIETCEELGFIFKRDIIWHKTNGVRAHFGTYPYPGGILINNMHEFILEFDKPAPRTYKKYAHLTPEQKTISRLSKEFWLSIKNSDVWLMKPEGSGDRRTHIAPFPEELPGRLIRAFSYIGETVLDPFSGSGTTLVAAARLWRNGIGYEIHADIAHQSIERLKAVRTPDGDAIGPNICI